MEEDHGQPRGLKSIFDEAEQNRAALEATYEANSPKFHEALSVAIKGYRQCLDTIYRISLFSPNETLDDISTSDLPYLLVNHHLAELIQKEPSTSPIDRRDKIRHAREAYEAFLKVLDQYELLKPPYDKLLAQYVDNPETFSTISTTDATARRNAKIANFRAEKQLKERLEQLRKSPRYLEHGDEEVVRKLHLAHLDFCTHMSFQGLESLNRELEVLGQATLPLLPQDTTVEEDERERRENLRADGFSDRLDRPLMRLQSMFGQSGPLLTTDGKPLQPFTLVGTRQELQNGVFRPGHNLPTMTIDEYLAEERKRGNIIEGGGEASMRQPVPDEDDMDKADAETMKAREWDEFKEANHRGAGNTLNRG